MAISDTTKSVITKSDTTGKDTTGKDTTGKATAHNNDVNTAESSEVLVEQNVQRNQQDIRAHNQAVILAAAEEEFVLQGFRGATMQGIADRAELPKANIQ